MKKQKIILTILIILIIIVSCKYGNKIEITGPNESKKGKIIFQSKIDGNWEIYVMNADGNNQTRLTDNSADDVYPTWSPDGTKIAFHSNRDGNWEIYVMNADGSNQINLTNNNTDDAIYVINVWK